MKCGVESSQLSLLIVCGAIIQACEAVWYTMRQEVSSAKQVRHIGQFEAIRNVDESLQHVLLSFGE